jgi:chitin synthase
MMCFIRVLGDPPRTSEWGYTFIVIGFAAITVYTTVAALLLTISKIFWIDQILRNYVLSLITTYGLYLFPTFIFVSDSHLYLSQPVLTPTV